MNAAPNSSETIRVSIGSEPMQRIPAAVLRHSIICRTKRRVDFLESWDAMRGWHPLMERQPPLKGGTAFNIWRWLTSQYFGEGKAIYLDSDQVVLADIGKLWDSLPAGKTVAAVCNAVGIFGKKVPEPGKLQSSVMVMDCAKLKDRARVALYECGRNGKLPYRDLMQATWLPRDEVHELPPEWNHFGIKTASTKLLHWSHVASQPYRNPEHPTANIFWRELMAAVESEFIDMQTIGEETSRGHLHQVYAEKLRREAA